jgi:hypothetical protein
VLGLSVTDVPVHSPTSPVACLRGQELILDFSSLNMVEFLLTRNGWFVGFEKDERSNPQVITKNPIPAIFCGCG